MSEDRYKGILGTPTAPEGPTGKNYLFAIAIDDYIHCPKLNNCVRDAEEFVKVLTTQYQFEPENILTLYNEAATRPNIHSKLKELKRLVQPNDNLVIFYSGHGEVVDDLGYWVPVGAHPEKEWEFFSTDEIRNRLNAINSFHTFVIVDACFSGSLFATYKSVMPGYETRRSRLGLTASHSRERALDGEDGENSPFARRLLKRLRENTGDIGVQKLATEVIEDVQGITGGRQTPVFKSLDVKGDDSGQYVFHPKADEEAGWAACQQAGTQEDYRAFLARHPRGKHSEEARLHLAELEEEQAWKMASEKNTILSYYQYNQTYPDGKYQQQALEAIRRMEEEQAWNLARQRNTLGGFLEYKSSYPEGRFLQEAEDRIQDFLARQEEPAAWQQAQAEGTVESYESYLQQFPKGKHLVKARAAIKELHEKKGATTNRQEEDAWKQARQTDTKESYQYYLKSFPRGKYAPEAKANLSRIRDQKPKATQEKKEQNKTKRNPQDESHKRARLAWAKAMNTETITAFEDFLRQYPNSPYSEEARQKIADLQRVHHQKQQSSVRKYLPAAGGILAVMIVIWGIVNWLGGSSPDTPVKASPKPEMVILGGKAYPALRFAGLTWMTSNLDYYVPDSWCYNDDPPYCEKYGRLYNWEAAKKACEEVGWRLPTIEEWRKLADLFGGAGAGAPDEGRAAYKALLEGGKSGFSAQLGGVRLDNGNFFNRDQAGIYWSATANGDDYAWGISFSTQDRKVGPFGAGNKAEGASCRCVQE